MEQSADRLNGIIAENLKRLRREMGISLDEAAERTGVSKSMLGQIERGACGPSVATLWKIANGLRISFTSLMRDWEERAAVQVNRSLEPLTNGTDRFRLYPIFPFEPGRCFEILDIEMEPGAESPSEPHAPGTEEYTMVYEGVLTLRLGDEEYRAPAGHSIRYPADRPHAYCNRGQTLVRLCMVIQYK